NTMAYVPGYEFDLFVSYAHVDNAHGWVDALDDILRKGLAAKLGRSEAFSVWRDSQNLRGNQEISGHIPGQVRKSANFLAVLSPGYSASMHCLEELQAFLDSVKPEAKGRLFVVSIDPIDDLREELKAFRDLVKYQFWI